MQQIAITLIFFLYYLLGFYLLLKAHVAAEGKIQYYKIINLVPRTFPAHPTFKGKALGTRL